MCRHIDGVIYKVYDLDIENKGLLDSNSKS